MRLEQQLQGAGFFFFFFFFDRRVRRFQLRARSNCWRGTISEFFIFWLWGSYKVLAGQALCEKVTQPTGPLDGLAFFNVENSQGYPKILRDGRHHCAGNSKQSNTCAPGPEDAGGADLGVGDSEEGVGAAGDVADAE